MNRHKNVIRYWFWIGLGLLSGVFLLAGAFRPIANLKSFTSSKYHLAFKYPEDWEVIDMGDNLYVKGPLGWGVQFFSELPHPVPAGLPPDQTLGLFLKQLPIPRIVAEEPIEAFQLGDYVAARKWILAQDSVNMPPELTAFPTPSLPPRESVFILVQDNGRKVLIVTFQEEGYSRMLDRQIKAIVDSFRFE